MPTFPLITHERPEQLIAWRRNEAGGALLPVTAGRFLREVAALAAILPPGRHMLNACADRYRFMLGLCAALVANKVSLLPSTTTPETIRELQDFAPDAFCLTDLEACPIALPQFRWPGQTLMAGVDSESAAQDASYQVPRLDGTQLAAYVFTSGSTGKPVPHPKTWGNLVINVKAESRLWSVDDGRSHAVLGTVPPQHMYGFESTVLVIMQSGNALVASQSFYPADICATLGALPRPRVLVSTPVHLRMLVAMDQDLPAADLLVSATAPLSIQLAREAEAAFSAPLLEIYGSTETGQIAMRRSTTTAAWQLFAGIELTQDGDTCIASGGHVEQPTRMNDVIELAGPGCFLLHGRHADLVNIAGKRSSLAYLNLQLNAIPGVLDGAFFMPEESGAAGVTRLTAFVVAPGHSHEALMAALRERVDPVFLPRPLHRVERLPRNDTGKLPLEALRSLARALGSQGRAK